MGLAQRDVLRMPVADGRKYPIDSGSVLFFNTDLSAANTEVKELP